MRVIAHGPEPPPVPTTYDIEGLTRDEFTALRDLVQQHHDCKSETLCSVFDALSEVA